MWDSVLIFLAEYGAALGAGAAALAILAVILLPFRSFARRFRKPEKVALTSETIVALKDVDNGADGPKLILSDFIRIRRELKAELLAELKDAPDDEKAQLRARIAELENQIANPDKALAEAQVRIAELEKLLEREANHLGAERVDAARAALKRGDYSVADGLFAEIEAVRELDAQEAARAAYGRGEIAEAEVRWLDAADHYEKAARLDPGYQTLLKAGDLLWRAGKHDLAIEHEEKLVKLAKREFGAKDVKIATALNNLATSYRAAGRYGEAEPLYREAQALAIYETALRAEHPSTISARDSLAAMRAAAGD